MGFPGSSAGKESACKARHPGLIPGLGRSTGEGIGYPFQYSWTSIVAQLVTNLPVMWETRISPWIGKIPWRRGWQPTPEVLLGEPHEQESLVGCIYSMGSQRVVHS